MHKSTLTLSEFLKIAHHWITKDWVYQQVKSLIFTYSKL